MGNDKGSNDDQKNIKKGEPKDHFWIPDSEVKKVKYDPTSRPKHLQIDHKAHGKMLQESLMQVKSTHENQNTPISDELIIFKLELRDNLKADNRGVYDSIFQNNHLVLNAIHKSNVAIVSSHPDNLNNINAKLNKYISANGRSSEFFQFIESISAVEGVEKKSGNLIRAKKNKGNKIDVQITFVPNLNQDIYSKMMKYVKEQIIKLNGEISDNDTYWLGEDTPVLRVFIPSSGLEMLSDQEIILKVEPSRFFRLGSYSYGTSVDLDDVRVQFNVDPRELPVVCILDDGVNFSNVMKDCVAGQWIANDITNYPAEHGTKVASRAIFGDDIDEQVKNKTLIPRVRIIDAVISDGGELYEGTLIARIKKAVEDIKVQTKIFNLSLNDVNPIDSFSVSNLAFTLDKLQRDGVQFCIPTGNHSLWTMHNTLEDIFDDDSSQLAAPAESYYGLTVGSITRDEHNKSLSRKKQISSFSRIGFGFAGSQKPDLVFPGGNVYMDNNKGYIAANSAAYVIDKNGKLVQEFGSSFSSPLAASDLALLTTILPEEDSLIAKALLVHHAENNDKSIDDELRQKIYGKGIGSYVSAKSSFRNKATYIRKGEMSRLIKERVAFYMPTTIADYSRPKIPVAKVNVTCLFLAPMEQRLGYEYLRAYIDSSLHCINSKGTLETRNPPNKEGRNKWQPIQHYSQIFTAFDPGDWQIWLQLFTKPEVSNDEKIKYTLIVSIEDLTGEDVEVYGGIELESGSRFRTLTEVHAELGNDEVG